VIAMVLGVYPMPVLRMIDTSLLQLIDLVKHTII